MKTYLAIAACFLAVVAYANAATKCVSCTGTTGTCADTYDKANNNNQMINCTNGCSKLRSEASILGATSVTYTRGCAVGSQTAKCSTAEGGVGGLASAKVTTCYCDGDFCNGSQKMALAIPALLVALVAALF